MEYNTPGLLYRDFSINMSKVLGVVCSWTINRPFARDATCTLVGSSGVAKAATYEHIVRAKI